MSFKDISYLGLMLYGGPFVLQSGTICEISLKGFVKKHSVKIFQI